MCDQLWQCCLARRQGWPSERGFGDSRALWTGYCLRPVTVWAQTQSQHTNYWAPRTRKRHQQEHRPQRPTESSDPTQHAKGRTGDRPGPRKGATTRRNVTQGVCNKGGIAQLICTPGTAQSNLSAYNEDCTYALRAGCSQSCAHSAQGNQHRGCVGERQVCGR